MILLINADFYTMSDKIPVAKSVLIENGLIREVFREKPAKINAEILDLKGLSVYPGFIDTHTHSFEGGLYNLGADLGNCSSLEEVFYLINKADKITDRIFAFNFDENSIKEKRFPTVDELDKVSKNYSILLRRVDGHSCVVNSKALKMIEEDTGILLKQQILRGEDNNTASYWFHSSLDNTGVLQAYHKAAELALKQGITTLHTMIGDARKDLLHYEFIKNSLSDFKVNYILYPQITDVKTALDIGSTRIGGCILADGSFGSHTAALREPYNDLPGCRGNLYYSDDFWYNFISFAHDNDLQTAVHCIGDRAINQILNIYKKVQTKIFKNLRHQIIHNELVDDDMINDLSEFGISASMQPMFDRLWGGYINKETNDISLYSRVLGEKRALSCNRFKSLLDREVLIGGGSDWYVTELNALKGINALINHHNHNEQLNPYQALELYTSKAAALSFDENRLGKIMPGYQADLTCLNGDLFNFYKNNSELDNLIKVVKVFRKGKLAFSLNESLNQKSS